MGGRVEDTGLRTVAFLIFLPQQSPHTFEIQGIFKRAIKFRLQFRLQEYASLAAYPLAASPLMSSVTKSQVSMVCQPFC
jgi:hypothetical protein